MIELRVLAAKAPWYDAERDDPVFAEVVQRAAAFCRRESPTLSPWWVMGELARSYEAVFPSLVAMAGTDAGRLVGYAVLAVDDVAGERALTVLILETFVAVPREVMRQAFADVHRVARSLGAKRIRAVALDPTRARVYRTFYGHWRELVLLEQEVSDGSTREHGERRRAETTGRTGRVEDSGRAAAPARAAGTTIRFPGADAGGNGRRDVPGAVRQADGAADARAGTLRGPGVGYVRDGQPTD